MRALVIYESVYGNTEQVAREIAAALERQSAEVEVQDVASFTSIPTGLDLLVIGGRTEAHGVSPTMRTFLDRLPENAVGGMAVAAFDTRLRWPRLLSGAASRGIAERLEHKGARIVAEPESFLVQDKDGPLVEGERERAAAWAAYLASAGAKQET